MMQVQGLFPFFLTNFTGGGERKALRFCRVWTQPTWLAMIRSRNSTSGFHTSSKISLPLTRVRLTFATILSSAASKSLQHQEKNSCEHWDSNPCCWVRSKYATSVPCSPILIRRTENLLKAGFSEIFIRASHLRLQRKKKQNSISPS